MSTTVKSLKVTYNPINAKNTFTNGDCISGYVTLEVAKDCQIDTLYIKFKGKAEVRWTEKHGERTVVYHSKDKYFSYRQYFIRDKDHKVLSVENGNKTTLLRKENGETYSSVIAPGRHVYPFTFQIPHQNIPSSLKGHYGKIVYLLEAKLGRSMRIDKTDSTLINFEAKPDPNSYPGLMTPQHGTKNKKMNAFTSGSVSMDVNLEKSGFTQGEGIKVLLSIQNKSSREIKPKYCVSRKISFFARGKRRLNTSDLFKEEGEPIPPSSNKNVTQVLPIPHDVEPTILNCSIIKREYRLKAYLDVKYASDPEVKFHIIILPTCQVSSMAPPPVASDFGLQPFGSTNPPAWGMGPPQPQSTNPPAWGFGPPQPQSTNPPAWGTAPPQPQSTNPPAWGTAPPMPQSTNPPAWGTAPPMPQSTNPPAWGTAPPMPQSTNPPAWGTAPPQPQSTNPPAWGTAPPQPPTAPNAFDPPPPYGTHGLYPPVPNFSSTEKK
ncbi:arrestin domain-containing protein 3-like [Centropristis striata]|uniref:arrestin domain-containing protein 3-like n=1 Tax=Centropristis striata TaxID=184440 RepID=UPI0027DF9CF6|nr:arrestin domain-containing protein 3-like [Centropristis striata]